MTAILYSEALAALLNQIVRATISHLKAENSLFCCWFSKQMCHNHPVWKETFTKVDIALPGRVGRVMGRPWSQYKHTQAGWQAGRLASWQIGGNRDGNSWVHLNIHLNLTERQPGTQQYRCCSMCIRVKWKSLKCHNDKCGLAEMSILWQCSDRSLPAQPSKWVIL